MAVQQSVGMTLKVVLGEPATFDAAGYATLEATATEVGEVIQVSPLGGSATVNTRTPIKTGVIDKAIGSQDPGNTTISMTKNLSDAGQTVLLNGVPNGTNGRLRHSFFVTESNGDKQYFTGKIVSFGTDGYTADSFVGSVCEVANDTPIIYA